MRNHLEQGVNGFELREHGLQLRLDSEVLPAGAKEGRNEGLRLVGFHRLGPQEVDQWTGARRDDPIQASLVSDVRRLPNLPEVDGHALEAQGVDCLRHLPFVDQEHVAPARL